ncbi:aldo/keto reductase [Actinoplanes sp. NPDC048988]|uniref:aldo/keto reductase n=1 Tax=Actinoplanes sp. NPDC048988 TaxID=3363901 RepID=UPI0037175DB9
MSIPLRPLGRTGVKVSALALGTMMFGSRGNTDHDDRVRIIHRALDAGINLVDTGQLGAAQVRLSRDVLDEIDKIVPPGVTLSSRDQGYQPPAITDLSRRRRSAA